MPPSVDPELEELNKMDDAALINIVEKNNGISWNEDYKIKARVILYKRKKRTDRRMLLMTLIILLLTAYLAYREYFREPPTHITTTVSTYENRINIPKPTEKSRKPQNKNYIAPVITHSSTSTKQK